MKLLHEMSLGNYQWISTIHITLTESDQLGRVVIELDNLAISKI